MKKVFVVNTSPLIYLAKLDRLHFLDDYIIIVPRHVKEELLIKESQEQELLQWFLTEKHVEILDTKIIESLPENLGLGEKAVISLAVEHGYKSVLLDDRKAVIIAQQNGLLPKGTLAVLITMKEKGVITEMEAIALLKSLCEAGFRVSTDFLVVIMQKLFRN